MSVLQFTEVDNPPGKINVSPMVIWLSFSMILLKLTGWIEFFWGKPWEKKGQITFTDAYVEMLGALALTVDCSTSSFTYWTLWSCLEMMSYWNKFINWTVSGSSTKVCKTSKGGPNRISVTWFIFLYRSTRFSQLHVFQLCNEFWTNLWCKCQNCGLWLECTSQHWGRADLWAMLLLFTSKPLVVPLTKALNPTCSSWAVLSNSLKSLC